MAYTATKRKGSSRLGASALSRKEDCSDDLSPLDLVRLVILKFNNAMNRCDPANLSNINDMLQVSIA